MSFSPQIMIIIKFLFPLYKSKMFVVVVLVMTSIREGAYNLLFKILHIEVGDQRYLYFNFTKALIATVLTNFR